MFSPDGLVVCHLPYGPTASFSISNTIMRHDIPNVGTMSEAFPHLIFHNFKTKLGQRVSLRLILKVYYWGKPERAPHRSLLRENHCSYVCVCVCVHSRYVIHMLYSCTYVWFSAYTSRDF